MTDEFIQLLVKEKKYKEAISLHVEKGHFDKVEEFCKNHQEPGLLTELLSIYFERHEEAVKAFDREGAEKFRKLALKLMQSQQSINSLNAEAVLNKIPVNWELKMEDVDLVGFLASLFDSELTIEENTRIAERVANMELFNTEVERNELESAYVVVRDDTECLVCHHKLDHKKIRVFPHGMAFHMRCSKNPSECPITKQRFDSDAILDQME